MLPGEPVLASRQLVPRQPEEASDASARPAFLVEAQTLPGQVQVAIVASTNLQGFLLPADCLPT